MSVIKHTRSSSLSAKVCHQQRSKTLYPW